MEALGKRQAQALQQDGQGLFQLWHAAQLEFAAIGRGQDDVGALDLTQLFEELLRTLAASGAGRADYVGSQAAEPLLARLFAHAHLRSDRDPKLPKPIRVRLPLPKPAVVTSALRILSPSMGAQYVAVSGMESRIRAVIHPRANRESGQAWFLNGTLLRAEQLSRLILPSARYRLLCVTPTGEWSVVDFLVR